MWQLYILSYFVALFPGVAPAGSDFLLPPPCQPLQLPARCKNIPGSVNWPPDTEWAKLKTAVGGRLLKPAAPAAACHRNAGVDTAGAKPCVEVKAEWHTARFHIEHPTSTI